MQPQLSHHRHVGAVVLPPSATPGHSASSPMIDLEFGSTPVDASHHVAEGTSWRAMLGTLLLAAVFLVALVGSMGGILFLLALGAVTAWLQARRIRAVIQGQAVRIDAAQLPELNGCVESFCARLGLKETPDLYLYEDGALNALALKLAGKQVVLLTDDAVWGALASKNPRALGFIIGHELAHIALGHTSLARQFIRSVFRPLARIDELSADNVARALVGDAQVAFDGVKLLTVGPQLSHYMNDAALMAQAQAVVANKLSAKVEKTMSHPLLMRRLHNVMR